ncbi:hypothetical protein [Bradyrhizobium diazoefficiens]|uniref:hypothetical protein n=1 Tax=Bradyrhizobium diazoefficiens TaxID=1355477 RepID=UPI001FEFE828|nr:hypothetical protein [Bradyrhizobium diazoefficiens]
MRLWPACTRGADLIIAYLDLDEDEDAAEVKVLVEKEGRKAVLIPGDIRSSKHCRSIVRRAVKNSAGSMSSSTTQRIRRHSSI